MSVLFSLTCVCLYCYHWPVHVDCNPFDLYQSILLPHWSVPVCPVHTDLYLPTVTTLICPCLHTDLYLSVLTCVSLYYSTTVTTLTSVYTITTDLYMSVLLPYWPVPAVTALTCTACYHWHVHVSTVTSDLCTLHVSTVTTLTCISLYCYHTDLYLSALLPHRPPVPVYCYHTDLSQSLLPHWHVPVSTVTTDLYVSLLLSHWPITTDLYLALLLY